MNESLRKRLLHQGCLKNTSTVKNHEEAEVTGTLGKNYQVPTFLIFFVLVVFLLTFLYYIPLNSIGFKDLFIKNNLQTSYYMKNLTKFAKFCNMNKTLMIHHKCRSEFYPRTHIRRFVVPDDKVDWAESFPEYNPIDYTADSVLNNPVWADADIRKEGNTVKPKWNSLDGNINRISHVAEYCIVDGVPRNPMGRTGIKGRGCLGHWGPNHAADPIVTRWKKNETGDIQTDNKGKNILQFIAIQRKDNGDWAIPGGMVDAGEVVSQTLRREFSEEALNSLKVSADDKIEIENRIKHLFENGKQVYKGYVDDPRNTDNSWMETVAMNFHDPSGSSFSKLNLLAGDDAVSVHWLDINCSLQLYASHSDFIKDVAANHGASW